MRIALYCSASNEAIDGFRDVAVEFGNRLGELGFELVYGGGDVGLMGVAARATHAAGGRVIGIIPDRLRAIEGIAYEVADELIVTETLQERKRLIFSRSDAFVVLPGGLGTLEEFAEVLTLRKLDYLDRPIALVNADGFFDDLLGFFRHLETRGFSRQPLRNLFSVHHCPVEALEAVQSAHNRIGNSS